MLKLKIGDQFTLIDEEDLEIISDWTWRIHVGGYVYRGTSKNGKSVHFYLHREIMKAKRGQLVDHINGNVRDNRRANLRICNAKQSARNTGVKRTGRKFKGIFWHSNRWMAQIAVDRKSIYLGRFKKEEDAAKAYDKAAKEYHGDFARLNFP